MKKAQGLSLNTIIIAALVLIVLVVLVIIFSGRMGKFRTDIEGAEEKAGYCIVKGGTCAITGPCERGTSFHRGPWNDCKEGEGCCY